MNPKGLDAHKARVTYWHFAAVLILLAALLNLPSCGGTSFEARWNPPQGSVSVSISDPPTCRVPNGNFQHVYITVRAVQAHISGSATDASGGWQELAAQLANQPVQIDLLATPQNGCVLAQLGSNTSLPVGDYQQIRVVLLTNTPGASDPVPTSNACGSQGYNCVVLADGNVHRIELSSQANTGLKIPPGQILGGPIRVESGKNVDINIDFNACASIVRQGNGKMRLKPTLTAGQVSTLTSGISGQVVDSTTLQPISGGQAIVAIEQADTNGIDRIVMQAAPDANGNFNFCPLPSGTFDVVAVAVDGSNVAYNATVLLNVNAGATLGKIPLVAETGTTPNPATMEGVVTSSTGSAGFAADMAMGAFQAVSLSGGGTRQITIPLLGDSTPLVATEATPSSIVCPTNTYCAKYKLIVPASNPSVGTVTSSGTTFAPPAAGDVLYTVEARAFLPGGGGTQVCSPSRQTTDKDSADQPLKVTGGATVTAKQVDFTGCTAP